MLRIQITSATYMLPYERQGNRMHTRAIQIAIVLDEMRADYGTRLELGMSRSEASVGNDYDGTESE